MHKDDIAFFVAAVSLGTAFVSVDSRIVTLPLAGAAIGYGLGSFNFCGLFDDSKKPPPPETVACETEAHESGVRGVVIGVVGTAVLMSLTDQWKKPVRLF